jgi:hypothetical protein
MMRGDGPNYQMRMDRVGPARPLLGEYDKEILCEKCDGKLGVYDDYAVDLCRRFKADHRRPFPGCFELADVDCDKFAKFVLAVLWRASISRRPHFNEVQLGSYESQACEILFQPKPLAAVPGFEVILLRYFSEQFDAEKLCTYPVKLDWMAPLNCYGFGLGGFRVVAKFDAESFPAEYGPFIINGQTALRGLFVRMEETSEFERIIEMFVADHQRRGD